MTSAKERLITTKPSRKALLYIIGELQIMAGRAKAIYLGDTAIDRADRLLPLLERMERLCIEARSFDPPE